MIRPRRALSFENVLVTVVLFAVLSGGVAYGAGQLGKGSVGKKQLRANAVSAAKIKKNAVTNAKLKKAAVSGVKVKDGAIGAAAFSPAKSPFSGTVASLSGPGPVSLEEPNFSKFTEIPLTNSTFVQQPGEIDFVLGQVQLSFTGACTGPKLVAVEIYYDSKGPETPDADNHEISGGEIFDVAGSSPNSVTLPITFTGDPPLPKVAATTNRTITAVIGGECKAGAASVTASNLQLEIFGVRE